MHGTIYLFYKISLHANKSIWSMTLFGQVMQMSTVENREKLSGKYVRNFQIKIKNKKTKLKTKQKNIVLLGKIFR